MALPTFLGIGAARSGTSWLDAVLRSHPDLYLPERRKEVRFFDLYYDRSLEWYEDFFPAEEIGQQQTPGEITPEYLYFPEVPARIPHDLPDCKFLLMLRNPAKRAYSHYGFLLRELNEQRSFKAFMEEEPEVFERGLYYEQLKRYRDRFPAENFLVLIFEEVMADYDQALAQIGEFLNIDATRFDPDVVRSRVNSSKQSRFPQARLLARQLRDQLRAQDLDWLWNLAKRSGLERMFESSEPIPKVDPAVHQALLDRYQADIQALGPLIDKDLSVCWR